jgi:hypothetical protein
MRLIVLVHKDSILVALYVFLVPAWVFVVNSFAFGFCLFQNEIRLYRQAYFLY